jgi:hypothetical protein
MSRLVCFEASHCGVLHGALLIEIAACPYCVWDVLSFVRRAGDMPHIVDGVYCISLYRIVSYRIISYRIVSYHG